MEIGEYKENKKALTTKERQMQMKMLGHEKREYNYIGQQICSLLPY